MASQVTIESIIGLGLLVVAIANAKVNTHGVKFGPLGGGKRLAIGGLGLLILGFPGWHLVRTMRQNAPQSVTPIGQQTAKDPNQGASSTCTATVSGVASTKGANSPATVAGCIGPDGLKR
jgi:hypothetical protein